MSRINLKKCDSLCIFFFYKIWFTRVGNSYDINIDLKTVEFLFYFNLEIHILRKNIN